MDDDEENAVTTGKTTRSYLNKDEKEIVLSKYDISSFFCPICQYGQTVFSL